MGWCNTTSFDGIWGEIKGNVGRSARPTLATLAVLSYISSLPVPGLNPITAQATCWIDINCDLHRNWLLEAMELNSNPEEFAELSQRVGRALRPTFPFLLAH